MQVFHRPKGSKGKHKVERKARDFWRWYFINNKRPIPYSKGMKLYPELMHSLLEMTIETGSYFLIPNLGNFCCVKRKMHISTEDGKLDISKIGIDWKATKDLWKEKYPNVSTEEIKKIEDRPYIYHRNKTTLGESLKIMWIRVPSVKYTSFKPTTTIEVKVGQKAKSGSVGNMTKEDFQILIKTLKQRRRKNDK